AEGKYDHDFRVEIAKRGIVGDQARRLRGTIQANGAVIGGPAGAARIAASDHHHDVLLSQKLLQVGWPPFYVDELQTADVTTLEGRIRLGVIDERDVRGVKFVAALLWLELLPGEQARGNEGRERHDYLGNLADFRGRGMARGLQGLRWSAHAANPERLPAESQQVHHTAAWKRLQVMAISQRPSKLSGDHSREVEAIEVHHRIPGRDEVVNELLLCVVTSVDLSQ